MIANLDNVVFKKYVKKSDNDKIVVSLTLEHNSYSIWAAWPLEENGEYAGDEMRLLQIFGVRKRDDAMERAVEIGKLAAEDIMKLPYISMTEAA